MADDLFTQITTATGLAGDGLPRELAALLERAGLDKEKLTLEELRRVVADYLQDVLVEAKEDLSRSANPSKNEAPAPDHG